MGQASPLYKGLPFLFLLAAGTYTLSLFTQIKIDYSVRCSSMLTGANCVTAQCNCVSI